MKTVIIYNHPYQGSFCHALMESAITGAELAGHTVDLIHLDSDKFNPVMSGQDLLAFRNHQASDPQTIDYIKRIKEADHLVLIFSIWWELMPAMMKGFIDKVIFPGATYNYTKSGYGMISTLSKLKSTTVISTMNTPKLIYRFIFGNALQKSLIKGILKKSGIKKVK